MRIAVAGGTGLIGRMVTDAARSGGHDVVVISRSGGVDLMTGAGLDDALRGADAVIDVANVTTLSRAESVAFFGTTTERLLAAGKRAGVAHHVALSIVGVDRVESGYYEGKLRQEELVKAGTVPWTILRATQFFEFAGQILGRVPGPVAVIPKMRSQPVAAAEVAAELVRIAVAGPLNRVVEMAGPDRLDIAAMAREVLRAQGSRRLVLQIPAGRAMAEGGLLPTGEVTLGRMRFAEWLADTAAPRP
ncbi:SDR family oxidoreductase [Actinoplanes sp. GCM10030250]|uniref:SDR family oxidoreductase n=1 Tax=Actinoplanes sp. GCM10030250 TaxID=3273376 RepID=UPI003622F4D1